MGCHVQLVEDIVPPQKKKRRKEGRKEVSNPKVDSTVQPSCGPIANLFDKQLKLKNNMVLWL